MNHTQFLKWVGTIFLTILAVCFALMFIVGTYNFVVYGG